MATEKRLIEKSICQRNRAYLHYDCSNVLQ